MKTLALHVTLALFFSTASFAGENRTKVIATSPNSSKPSYMVVGTVQDHRGRQTGVGIPVAPKDVASVSRSISTGNYRTYRGGKFVGKVQLIERR